MFIYIYTFFVFQCEISELRQPIAPKFCTLISSKQIL